MLAELFYWKRVNESKREMLRQLENQQKKENEKENAEKQKRNEEQLNTFLRNWLRDCATQEKEGQEKNEIPLLQTAKIVEEAIEHKPEEASKPQKQNPNDAKVQFVANEVCVYFRFSCRFEFETDCAAP
jgi:hypothetical protein